MTLEVDIWSQYWVIPSLIPRLSLKGSHAEGGRRGWYTLFMCFQNLKNTELLHTLVTRSRLGWHKTYCVIVIADRWRNVKEQIFSLLWCHFLQSSTAKSTRIRLKTWTDEGYPRSLWREGTSLWAYQLFWGKAFTFWSSPLCLITKLWLFLLWLL